VVHIVHYGVSGARNINALFFMLGRDRYGFHRKRIGTRYSKLVLLHPVGSVGHVVHSSAFGVQKVEALFLMLRWDRYGFHKKRAEAYSVEVVFLYPLGCVGHVVHFGAFRAQNIDTLFFMLGWASADSTKCALGHVMPNLRFCIRWDLSAT
jgi:hypothetical protein